MDCSSPAKHHAWEMFTKILAGKNYFPVCLSLDHAHKYAGLVVDGDMYLNLLVIYPEYRLSAQTDDTRP